ncbi:aminopeptidase N [Methyloceanibacter methanicus]|uniref:Aminopeptidase N n=1 Tax=Methyloceanibacter methanicus TaxID=1774968 RepID=A0A1E3VZX0_9HYPH|nr:aminopeptidase N [Methyloceanibacter methanicus]ODR98446.1 aminopeptidase N [Methyloceanibacter methanicus]
MNDESRSTKFLKDYAPPDYLIKDVSLDVTLAPKGARIASLLSIEPNSSTVAGTPLVLDGDALRLESIALNGDDLEANRYTVTPGKLTITNPPVGPFTLDIVTLCDPEANTELSGLYLSNGTYCTQCEPEGFRRITYFVDRPDVLATYTVRIEADRETAPVLLSNGNPVESGAIEGTGRHYAVWHDPHPKPSYLFALVGGNLASIHDSFTTASGREVALGIYVEPGKEDRCDWAMESLKRAMRWDEERFGLEYDLDVFNIVAVSDFNMGAMENKGLNIFNDKLVLARPDTASDADYTSIESVIAHEYFHNWTGNRVTCRDWFQLCLKEGLTVFRDQEFTGDVRMGPVMRILTARLLKARQFPEDAGPLSHPVRPASYIEINNFYTATVYEKGAELCRMLQTLLGQDAFRNGIALYFERHDGEAATVENFVNAMADASGRDLSQFMRWYTQAGTPEIACSLDYDPHAKTARLRVNQVVPPTPGQGSKEPMHIPLKVGLIGANGDELPLKLKGELVPDGLLEVTEREQVFEFEDIPAPPTPSILRDFSAPVRVTTSLKPEQIEFLMIHDSDPFNRWQAAQTYATDLIASARGTGSTSARSARPRPAALRKAWSRPCATETLAPTYRAETLKLPSESDIARELGRNVDTDAILTARDTLRTNVSAAMADTLSEIYDTTATDGAFSPDPDSAGLRALRNAALDLMSATGTDEATDRALRHYRDATNMTDAITALSILSQIPSAARDEALADFYARWQDDPLVLDKWFAVQARAARPDSVETVHELLSHPKFSLKNPNRVRALIGSFAMANPSGFNRADGAGYRFLADQALKIDGFNPHVAARLLGAFESWKTLEPRRQALARAALQDLARQELSTDAYEIVTKTLGTA